MNQPARRRNKATAVALLLLLAVAGMADHAVEAARAQAVVKLRLGKSTKAGAEAAASETLAAIRSAKDASTAVKSAGGCAGYGEDGADSTVDQKWASGFVKQLGEIAASAKHRPAGLARVLDLLAAIAKDGAVTEEECWELMSAADVGVTFAKFSVKVPAPSKSAKVQVGTGKSTKVATKQGALSPPKRGTSVKSTSLVELGAGHRVRFGAYVGVAAIAVAGFLVVHHVFFAPAPAVNCNALTDATNNALTHGVGGPHAGAGLTLSGNNRCTDPATNHENVCQTKYLDYKNNYCDQVRSCKANPANKALFPGPTGRHDMATAYQARARACRTGRQNWDIDCDPRHMVGANHAAAIKQLDAAIAKCQTFLDAANGAL